MQAGRNNYDQIDGFQENHSERKMQVSLSRLSSVIIKDVSMEKDNGQNIVLTRRSRRNQYGG